MCRRSKGFTLIELLVVIAIIAILAAILFPVFARAREKARQTACLSNVKQIMLGVLMYTSDWDERFPGAWAQNTSSNLWSAAIEPYVKNAQLFQCPSGTYASGWGGWDRAPRTMYGYNCDVANKALCNGGRSIGVVQQPATVIMLGDMWNSYWFADRGFNYGDGRLNPVAGISCWGGSRCPIWDGSTFLPNCHNEGGNYAHVDGHAKFYRPSQIYPSSATDATKDDFWTN
jgi:prepilin-type N-terminal cleavage/methylation domain-containing protein/prepilin-type processing-associated H-X9-DG protein